MQKTIKTKKIVPKHFFSGTKSNSFFNRKSTMRSFQSKLIDLIPLNQTILLDCSRRDKFD